MDKEDKITTIVFTVCIVLLIINIFLSLAYMHKPRKFCYERFEINGGYVFYEKTGEPVWFSVDCSE